MTFAIGASIALLATGILTACHVVSRWRVRSQRNYERFAHAYAQARVALLEARQAGDRA